MLATQTPSASHTLDHLPAEIVKKIASLCTAPDVLALLGVSRRLYSLCNDSTIFKAIIENQNCFTDQEPWYEGATGDYARFALGDYHARSGQSFFVVLPPGHEEQFNDEATWDYPREKTYSWALNLAIRHHPFVETLKILDLTTLFFSIRYGVDPQTANQGLGFILACAVLYRVETAWYTDIDDFGEREEVEVEVHYDGDNDYIRAYLQARAAREQREGEDRRLEFRRLARIRTEVLEISRDIFDPGQPNISLFAMTLCLFEALFPDKVTIPMPSVLRIPFADLVDLPPPFDPAWGTLDLKTCHVRGMNSKEFLESGEWVGYYSLSPIHAQGVSFDAPMHRITFEAREISGMEGGLMLSARGVDEVGKFSLNGQMTSEGSFRLQKLYDANFGWHWDARMTPFGIIGIWGGAPGERVGNMWIWKREWSD